MEFRKLTCPDINENRIKEIATKFSVTEYVANLLLLRNIKTDREIHKFLNPSLNDLHNPMLLADMDKVVEKIKISIQENKRILIFGDYDVDGISASYILLDYFKKLGATVDAFLPNRYVDGYGLTIEALDKEIARFNPNLIITVDCGITGVNEVEYIKSRGIDVIVTDHHDCPEILPDCLIINAKRPNQKYPFNELCGTGVAFKLVEALSNRETAMKYLPITAFATVADIVPLLDENRAIVKFGLNQPLQNFPLGVAMLAKEMKITKKMTSQDVSFKLAPKINAAGRMGNAQHSLNLYLEKDRQKAQKLIAELLEYNTERQDICNIVYEDCIREIKKLNLANHKAIVLAKENWNIGILGIVASRIADEFNRPTFLLGLEGDFYKGSSRSVAGINVHKILSKMENILFAFGGHTMAAGMTVEKDKISSFIQEVEKLVSQEYENNEIVPYEEFDLEIDAKDINSQFIESFNRLEPFGCQNPVPLFKITFDKVVCSPMKNHAQHLMAQMPNLTLICFNKPEYYNLLSQHSKKEALVELQVDNYRGSKTCKGIIKLAQLADYPNVSAERIGGEYIKQLSLSSYGNTAKYNTYRKDKLDDLLCSQNSLYGTLIIANTLQSYKDFLEKTKYKNQIVCTEYLHLTNSNGFNTLCLCPSIFNNLNNFNRIVLLDSVLDEAYIVTLNNKTEAEIYLPQSSPFLFAPFRMIDLSRKTFGLYFNLIKTASKQKISGFDDFNFFNKLKKLNKAINYVQFVACINTFEQIGIITIHNSISDYFIEVNKGASSLLEKSPFYNKLSLILRTY